MPSLTVQYFLRNHHLQAQFFVKFRYMYCIQRPFIGNMTALNKMWHFLEGVLSSLVGKNGDAEASSLYASRCGVF